MSGHGQQGQGSAPNLTQRPPRSPRVRLGGYAMLPRVLDKARASLVGQAGDYKFGNPMDQHFFAFTGIAQDALLEKVKEGGGDWDFLQWVNAQANPRRFPHEIRAWSAWLETMPIGDAEDLEWFAAQVKRLNAVRTDLHTIMDYLDADDHASFGGQA
ncbi:MAG: DUF5069 domain-containing protein [Verrucomicrobiales bacterium]|nr:DUF5069 domain-containing protein [Verrucomicrobiales bacterium]